MRLEVEKKAPVNNVTEKQLLSAIAALRSYGPTSFASLTDEHGNYLQVAGGGVTCMLERRDASSGRHFRGYKSEKSKVFPDGTALIFGGGEIHLAADEWFSSKEISEAFIAFLHGANLPSSINWRDITAILSEGRSESAE